MRIRLSLGLEPDQFQDVIKDSLQDLDKILAEYDFTNPENSKVEDCFIPCEKHIGKKETDRTGNKLLAAMRSDDDKWDAFNQAQHYLNQTTNKSQNYPCKAFEQYLQKFVIDRKVVATEMEVSTPKHLSAKERLTVDNFNASPIFAILNNLVNYAAEFAKDLPELAGEDNELMFKQSYWHSLSKLFNNCNKAIDLLTHINDFEVSHLYAKANLLIENLLEYLISLDTLKQILQQDQGKKVSPVAELTATEKSYAAQIFDLDEDQVSVYFADSCQQAITTSLLAMDMELVETEKQEEYCDHSVYVHDDSYFELHSFLKEVDTLKTNNKKGAKIVSVDITTLHNIKFKHFPNMQALVIDIIHHPTADQKILKNIISEMHEKNIWVVLASSNLKHDELGIDKYQSGKIITLAPKGEVLSDNVIEELQSISDEAMPRSVAAYLQMDNQVYQGKTLDSVPATAAAPLKSRQAPILAKFGIFPDKAQQQKVAAEPVPKHRSTAGLAQAG